MAEHMDRIKPCIIEGVRYSSVNEACTILRMPRGTVVDRIRNKSSPRFKDWRYEEPETPNTNRRS